MVPPSGPRVLPTHTVITNFLPQPLAGAYKVHLSSSSRQPPQHNNTASILSRVSEHCNLNRTTWTTHYIAISCILSQSQKVENYQITQLLFCLDNHSFLLRFKVGNCVATSRLRWSSLLARGHLRLLLIVVSLFFFL